MIKKIPTDLTSVGVLATKHGWWFLKLNMVSRSKVQWRKRHQILVTQPCTFCVFVILNIFIHPVNYHTLRTLQRQDLRPFSTNFHHFVYKLQMVQISARLEANKSYFVTVYQFIRSDSKRLISVHLKDWGIFLWT